MAREVVLICDRPNCRKTGAEAVTFELAGITYEADICAEHRKAFEDATKWARRVTKLEPSGRYRNKTFDSRIRMGAEKGAVG